MKHIVLFTLVWLLAWGVQAQSISGKLPLLNNETIRLEGFDGFSTYPISSTLIDENGFFELGYSEVDYGVGYLVASGDKPFIIILSGEDIELSGELLSYPESITILNGAENQWFEQYAIEHPRRERALNAWNYLEQLYMVDDLFSEEKSSRTLISAEKQRIQEEDAQFLADLPENSYVKWFLPTRKLVSSVSTVAQYRVEEIPSTIAAFRTLNHADPKLYKSGLLRETIEGHFWLIENSGNQLDTVVVMMKNSIDILIDQLLGHDDLLNEITSYLFDLLERQSLFEASEHLALRLLNESGCTLETDLARQLETYRVMRRGNIASDIVFSGDCLVGGRLSDEQPNRLSELKRDYVLVVFAASWCPNCREELPKLIQLYPKWRDVGVEIVLISLDEDKNSFREFAGSAPFLSMCDYQKWEGKVVSDYHVFGTPTFFLLDASRRIVLRPNSVNHANAWVEQNLGRR